MSDFEFTFPVQIHEYSREHTAPRGGTVVVTEYLSRDPLVRSFRIVFTPIEGQPVDKRFVGSGKDVRVLADALVGHDCSGCGAWSARPDEHAEESPA